MPNYWITTHYPHPLVCRQRPDVINVFHKEYPKASKLTIKQGDVIYFRECMGGKKKQVVYHNGKDKCSYPGRRGTGGMFAQALVKRHWRERTDDDAIVDHGDIAKWRWIVECDEHEFCKDIPIECLRNILDLSPRDTLRYLSLWQIRDAKLVTKLEEAFSKWKQELAHATFESNVLSISFRDPNGIPFYLSVQRKGDDQWKLTTAMYDRVRVAACPTKYIANLVFQAIQKSSIEFDEEPVAIPDNFVRLFVDEFKNAFSVTL